MVGGPAVDVLLDGEAGVDAGAVDLGTLHVERTHRRAHALGAHGDDVDVVGEGGAHVVEVPEEEAVRQAERGAGLEVGEDLLEERGLGGIGDQEDDEVGLGDDVEHLAEGPGVLGEPGLTGGVHGRRAGTQADLHRDVGAGQRIAQVLGLGGTLGAPADHADLRHAVERLGQQGKQVATAAHDGLLGPRHLDDLLGEDLRLEVEFLRHRCGPSKS